MKDWSQWICPVYSPHVGPAYVMWFLQLCAGITSFGRGCGRPQLPGVYADVTKLKSWINSKINAWAPEAPGTLSS